MRKTKEDLSLINIIIKKHIETISGKGRSSLDKEIDYLLIQEAIEALIREYNLSSDSRTRNYIKTILIEVDKKMFTYLLNINKLKPEEARGILPLDTKCEVIMTGFVSDWKHFFDLRALGTTGKPHPQAKELAEPLMEEFKTLGYI
jgi:thymidylate synthase ThyX